MRQGVPPQLALNSSDLASLDGTTTSTGNSTEAGVVDKLKTFFAQISDSFQSIFNWSYPECLTDIRCANLTAGVY